MFIDPAGKFVMFARFDTILTANMCIGGDPVLFLQVDDTVLGNSGRTFSDVTATHVNMVLFGKMNVIQTLGNHAAKIMAGCDDNTRPLSTPSNYNVAFLTINTS